MNKLPIGKVGFVEWNSSSTTVNLNGALDVEDLYELIETLWQARDVRHDKTVICKICGDKMQSRMRMDHIQKQHNKAGEQNMKWPKSTLDAIFR